MSLLQSDESELLLLEGTAKKHKRMSGDYRSQRTPSHEDEDFIEIQTTAQPDISRIADKSQGTTSLTEGEDNLPAGSSQYDDFHTIDWQRDLARDRLRRRYVISKKTESAFAAIKSALDGSSGWICVLLVGVAAENKAGLGILKGVIAGVMDIGTKWLSDLKEGMCADAFWFDREHCCWSVNTSSFTSQRCDQWHTWPELFGRFHSDKSSDPLSYIGAYFFYVFWALIYSGLAVLLVRIFAPYACASGIPEIKCILSGFIIRGYLGKWTLIIKSVGLMLSTASGLNLGKEGPMVHVACCIGNIFAYAFPKYGKNEAKKREILSAAAAAGISVAFGAPIGGVLFSLEEASYYFPLKTLWRSFFCALIAGLFLRIINPFGSDQSSLFAIDYHMEWSYIEMIAFVGLGIYGGVVGTLFIKLNIWWCKHRKASILGLYPMTEILILTGVTAVFGFPNGFTRMSSSSLIKMMFNRCGPEEESDLCDYANRSSTLTVHASADSGGSLFGPGITSAIWQLVLAMFFKIILTAFTFGTKIPAGIFVPSMAIGSIAGRLCGLTMQKLFFSYSHAWWVSEHCEVASQCVIPGLYAVVGAAAVLGGVTRMTISLVVIMFELTGRLELIVPTMAAVMFAKWIGDFLDKQGIYDAHIALNNYPFLDSKEEFQHVSIAEEVMKPGGDEPLRVLTQDTMTIGDIEQLLQETDYNGFPVVVSTDSQYLVGFVTRRDLTLAISNARRTLPGIVTNSIAYFTNKRPMVPELIGAPVPLKLRKLLDLAPIQLIDKTPMETVIEMFRKLGLRQVMVTRNGRLRGIITKKDVLKHLIDLEVYPRIQLY